VMEFVDGESLGRRIEREGRLPEAEVAETVQRIVAERMDSPDGPNAPLRLRRATAARASGGEAAVGGIDAPGDE